ncbi:PREDICTED: ephrin-B2a-like isoform X2 [Acropora digitifera]|uniref:ephrin-B2a-like isoform X2 n=1 Tax=Acropora digitifera TaxID=70779 RepID=UPI00077A4817|nr:PREDICTED: ephrin-B2a-like isoform X2 [Acropora digitifera]XP_015753607.1 PREDICTED: ephrin-B2a-like isoform X2 [Acropora digitifera]
MSDETRFKQGTYHLNVLPDAKVMVICPHTVISLVKTDLQTAADPDNLVENFWQVDYDSFWSCNVDTSNPSNRLFFKCEDPRSLHYEQFIFQSFGIGNRPTFQKGKTHYFVSTANGSKESLDKTSGGHCEEFNMRLEIYVCQNSADVLCTEAQSTAPLTTVPTVSFSGTDVPGVSLTPDGKPQQNKGTLNVFERNVWLKIAIIPLGFLLLISVFVNIFLIVKIRNRKCSTPEMRDSNKHLSNYSGST